ncbi:ribosomal protein S18 [Chytriomyces sp. MP71]|nr:ribosomal protein S18 [Chytriomyces sp. MP71]
MALSFGLRSFPLLRRSLSSTSRAASAPNNPYLGANIDSDLQARGGTAVRRLFKPYQTYEPEELNQKNAVFYQKLKAKEPKVDIFAILNINPLDFYKNTRLLSHFVTEMGHIKPRTETGLGIVNQKRLAKAIKRAQAMGLMPYTYKL